jgi:hypothetical protein
MTHAQFVSIKKLTGSGIVAVASKHNLRELGLSHGTHIDLRKSASNRILRGPDNAAAVAELARSLMDAAGVTTLRKDAVRALEIVFSLPASSGIDAHDFLVRSVAWVEQHFGAPVISAIEHHDEGAPHAHVLLVPLVDGCMVGSRMMGGPSKLRATQEAFHDQVGRHFGLTRKAHQTRLSSAYRRRAADAAIGALKANVERLNDPEVAAALGALIGANGADPDQLLRVLGIQLTPQPLKPKARPAKSFVAQMTRVMKPERKKHIGFDEQNPIGFAPRDAPAKPEAYLCVGFDLEPASLPPDERHHAAADVESVRRVRDDEAGPGYWCEVRGEWVTLPAKSSGKMRAILPQHH